MQIKLFTIPINNIENYNDELNAFLRSHKIVQVEKHLVQTENSHSWCFYISYIDSGSSPVKLSGGKKKIDYKEVLNEADFAKFSVFREIRKKIAKDQGVSAYIVFTDAELAEITKLEQLTIANIKKIKGIGEKKAEKYGKELIKQYEEQNGHLTIDN